MLLVVKKLQLGRNDFEFVEIDLDDEKAVQALKLHNKEVNHLAYLEKKYKSRYSVEDIERLIGHEFIDENSDPYERLKNKEKENFYSEKKLMFNKGLSLLNEAMSTLTNKQVFVITQVFAENLSLREISRIENLNFKTVRTSYTLALKKLKKFYLKNPEFVKYFPNLNKDYKKYYLKEVMYRI